MSKIIEKIKESIPFDCFSDLEISGLISGSKNKRYGLIKRAIAQGDLIHLRRGLYCLTEKHRRNPLNLFSISQKIYGPSCVSLESALSYHGWIPEAVYTVTCVTSQRSKDFETPLGKFSYRRLPLQGLFIDVERRTTDADSFFMARPWRALADYVFAYKKDWKSLDPLKSSLRIEDEFLQSLDAVELKEIDEAYRSRRVSRFLKGISSEIKSGK